MALLHMQTSIPMLRGQRAPRHSFTSRKAPKRHTAAVIFARASQQSASSVVDDLIGLVEGTDRGAIVTGREADILAAVETLQQIQDGKPTTDSNVDGTWRLLWSTEKETRFIVSNAKLFGTKAGEVYQVIDTQARRLQNVITFPPSGSFIVDSSIDPVPDSQRINFRFTSAALNVQLRRFPVPPYGKGWFESVYLDDRLRIAKDIRNDTLIAIRDGPPRIFS